MRRTFGAMRTALPLIMVVARGFLCYDPLETVVSTTGTYTVDFAT